MKPIHPSSEPLESRIAPASVFPYTDSDGDKVTIHSSAGDLENDIHGGLGSLKVNGSVTDEFIAVFTGNVGPVFIGGSLVGGTMHTGGNITALDGSMGKVTINGDILGGSDTTSGAVAAH